MRSPVFWWRPRGVLSALLYPFSLLYGYFADRPFGKGVVPQIPVLCIGNFVVGGAGKTPLAIALCERLIKKGQKPVFLSRGYGGQTRGPHLVNAKNDKAEMVGDEPLLLCQHAPTVVAADRVAGAEFITSTLSADIIIMDDGFQSARIKPSSSLLIVDHERGMGNGHVLPAGPLRARLATQMAHADHLFVIQGAPREAESTHALIDQFRKFDRPVYKARLKPAPNNKSAKSFPAKVIAFSGIGHPNKFFQSLRESGADLIEEISFPDHHFFTQQEAEQLLEKAEKLNAGLVTTTKDAVRFQGRDGALGRLADSAQIFKVDVVFEDKAAIDELLSALMP